MATILYGIKNCDTVKRARQWLDAQGIVYHFHDYQRSGVQREQLVRWCGEMGWDVLLNRAGTTFRKLPETRKTNLDEHKAIDLMLEQPSMIKRPVVEFAGGLLVGFKVDIYTARVSELRGSM